MIRKTSGLNDDRRVVLFHSGRRIAMVGDLRDPIVLARSMRTPDNLDAFTKGIAPYYKTWAAVELNERHQFDNSDVETTHSHKFTIRTNNEISIEERDVVIWKDEMFLVRSTKLLGIARVYLAIQCVDWARFTSELQAAGVTQTVSTVAPSLASDNTLFWDQV